MPGPTSACGDGYVDPTIGGDAGPEECDPGKNADGGETPGCTSACKVTCDGGVIDPLTKHCYFPLLSSTSYGGSDGLCTDKSVAAHVVTFASDDEASFIASAGFGSFWIGLVDSLSKSGYQSDHSKTASPGGITPFSPASLPRLLRAHRRRERPIFRRSPPRPARRVRCRAGQRALGLAAMRARSRARCERTIRLEHALRARAAGNACDRLQRRYLHHRRQNERRRRAEAIFVRPHAERRRRRVLILPKLERRKPRHPRITRRARGARSRDRALRRKRPRRAPLFLDWARRNGRRDLRLDDGTAATARPAVWGIDAGTISGGARVFIKVDPDNDIDQGLGHADLSTSPHPFVCQYQPAKLTRTRHARSAKKERRTFMVRAASPSRSGAFSRAQDLGPGSASCG